MGLADFFGNTLVRSTPAETIDILNILIKRGRKGKQEKYVCLLARMRCGVLRSVLMKLNNTQTVKEGQPTKVTVTIACYPAQSGPGFSYLVATWGDGTTSQSLLYEVTFKLAAQVVTLATP